MFRLVRVACVFAVASACGGDPEPDFGRERASERERERAASAHEDPTAACRRGDLAQCIALCGSPAACHDLGLLREPGDSALALQLYLAACDGDVLEGCGAAADLLRATDPARAVRLATRACDGDVGIGCNNLGVIRQVDGDLAAAADAYRRGCELGVAISCTATAALRSLGLASITTDDEIAFAQRGCDGGDAVGCANLGRILIRGVDPPRAVALFRRACALDHAVSCYDLALSLGRGEGGPVDVEGANAAARRGCELGSAEACSLFAPPR